MNHPFVDGNKRTGFLAMVTLLRDDGVVFNTNNESAYNFVIQISTGELDFDAIVIWLKQYTEAIQP